MPPVLSSGLILPILRACARTGVKIRDPRRHIGQWWNVLHWNTLHRFPHMHACGTSQEIRRLTRITPHLTRAIQPRNLRQRRTAPNTPPRANTVHLSRVRADRSQNSGKPCAQFIEPDTPPQVKPVSPSRVHAERSQKSGCSHSFEPKREHAPPHPANTRELNEQGSREVPSKRRSILLSLTRSIHHATAASDARRQTRSSELSPSLPPACARNEHIIRHSAHAPERQRPHGTPSTPPGGGLSLAPVSFVIEQGPCHLIPSLFRTCARCTRARGTGASLMLLCSFGTFVSALIIFIIHSLAMESSNYFRVSTLKQRHSFAKSPPCARAKIKVGPAVKEKFDFQS